MPNLTIVIRNEAGVAWPTGNTTFEINDGAPFVITGPDDDTVYAFTDDENVKVRITRPGYHPYENTFRMYNEDTTIQLRLAPTTPGNTVYSYYVQIPNYCSDTIDLYLGISTVWHRVEWKIDSNTKLVSDYPNTSSFFPYLSAGVYAIDLIVSIYNDPAYIGGGSLSLIDSDTSSKNITKDAWKPTGDIVISQTNPCETECLDCINQGDTIDFDAPINMNSKSDCTSNSIKWYILDIDGIDLLNAGAYEAIITWDPTTTPTPSASTIRDLATVGGGGGGWVFTDAGKYTIRLELTTCCTTCTIEKTITVVQGIKIRSLDVKHQIELENCFYNSADNFHYGVLDSSLTEIGATETLLTNGNKVTITLPGDGIYFIRGKADANPPNATWADYWMIVNVPDIHNCMMLLAQSILCEDEECGPCGNMNSTKRRELWFKVSILWEELLNLINIEAQNNYRYDPAIVHAGALLLGQFQSIDDVIDALTDYCAELDCGSNTAFNTGYQIHKLPINQLCC